MLGQLSVPDPAVIYLDTCCVIYTVERHPDHFARLSPIWSRAETDGAAVATSELALLECLVGPLRSGDATVLAAYEAAFQTRDLRLVPIDESVLRLAAGLRASCALRTPDAIHAATALRIGATAFITNDAAFRRVPGLAVQLVSEIWTSTSDAAG